MIQAKVGVVADMTMGDFSSEGYVADKGVFKLDGRGAGAGFASVVVDMSMMVAVS